MSEKTYKILQLQAENVKRLRAISITPDGNMVEITGKNGHGKTSTLDAIEMALGRTVDIPTMPIRKGEEGGKIVVRMDGLTITREFKYNAAGELVSPLIVEADELGKVASPTKVLEKLLGSLTFDPMEFTRMKPAEQFNMLKAFVPDFDFKKEAENRKVAFDERTDVNRTLKSLKAQVAAITFPDDTPDVEVDVTALTDEIQAIADRNSDIVRRQQNRERVADEILRLNSEAETIDKSIADLEQRIATMKADAAEKRSQVSDMETRLAEAKALPEPEDPSEIRAKIAGANATNNNVRLKLQRNELIAKAEREELEADRLTREIELSDKRKEEAISNAKMPIDGVGFGDGIVMLNGVPFDQASGAEQLRTSISMAMANNPKLHVILVRDGSLLDDDSWKILTEMAAEKDYQIWVEVVDSDRPGAVIIEDGMIKSTEHREAAE